MRRWSMLLIIAVVTLLVPLFSGSALAQDGANLVISKSANPSSASVGDNITYTFTVQNTGNVTICDISLTDCMLWASPHPIGDPLDAGDNITIAADYTIVETDLPGPIMNTANVTGTDPNDHSVSANASASVNLNPYTASIEVTKSADKTSASPHETITYTYHISNSGNVTIGNITLKDDKLGPVPLSQTTLPPQGSLIATDNYTVTIDNLPGPIVNTANVTGVDPAGKWASATSNSVSVSLNKSLMTKAEILEHSGVPGKGIATAPGLQKPFNPRSRAAEHAGKKNHAIDRESPQNEGHGKPNKEQHKIRWRFDKHP